MLGLLVVLGFQSIDPIWSPAGVADDPDSHLAFRGRFTSKSDQFELKVLGASEYLVWVDGQLVSEGPPRFAKGHPEYQIIPIKSTVGQHVIAAQVRNDGVTTRILSQMHPFLWCSVLDQGGLDLVSWRCARLGGYRPQAARISDILGWADWCDTRKVWPDWQLQDFDDSTWLAPVRVDPPAGDPVEAKTGVVRQNLLPIKPVARGQMCTRFGYETDDPAVRFFLDVLDPKETPSQGVWRRYDLGRVRLGRPKLTIDAPSGAAVEIAMCESLQHGRVHPWITLSGSRSCNMDHFVARGGVQEFMPFTPKGGRFIEVHVKSLDTKFVSEQFLERTYFGGARGTFACSDPLLNKIWSTGVNTVQACSEDALVDCPTRERGQWTGDVASVASEIVAVAFGDLRLTRRALVQAAQSARADGLVAGVGPGDPGYLSTYAAQWMTACVRYWELTGDKSLLQELLPSARRNFEAFEAKRNATGISDDLGWAFVDWGYVRNEGASDRALDLHTLMGYRSLARWEAALGEDNRRTLQSAEGLQKSVETWLEAKLANKDGWGQVGYQRASLALLAGIVPRGQKAACIVMIKRHLLSCFPNDAKAPRLSDPGVSEERVMTPYFCHFAFQALMANGETEFVVQQYKKCWGWALKAGLTTWPEVFDLRWSHCHEWSGCPTWQLTHFVLGLRPRFDVDSMYFEFDPSPGALKWAEGDLPLEDAGNVHVKWVRQGDKLKVKIDSPRSVHIKVGNERLSFKGSKSFDMPLPDAAHS